MESGEKAQLDLAIQLSQTENEELSARMQESCRRVDARLRLLGLRRVPVPAEGNCQFDALVYSADVPMSAMEMRSFGSISTATGPLLSRSNPGAICWQV